MTDNNQEVRMMKHTIEFDDKGMLTSVLLEEVEGFGRWLYKRHPRGMELPLTDSIFAEMVETILDNGFSFADELYENLRVHDEYYAKLMKKVYKQYIKKNIFGSKLHKDAFWGE